MTIETTHWGDSDGRPVHLDSLTNPNGLLARISDFGASVVELDVPDRRGRLADVVLGLDSLDNCVATARYFTATVGRVGNRIANAAFDLEGRTYELFANHGPHHLHGGEKGWDKVAWSAQPSETPAGPSVLAYRTADGEEGYPGTVDATTRYTLTNDNELAIEMTATTDRTTIVNMVHHTYFNLGDGADCDVRDQLMQLHADRYTPGMPPDDRVLPVAGTPFDWPSRTRSPCRTSVPR